MKQKNPPTDVLIGLAILISATVIDLFLRIFIKGIPAGLPKWDFIFQILLSVVLSVFLTYNIYKGRYWARTFLLIITSIVIVISIISLPAGLSLDDILFTMAVFLEEAILVVSLFFLYRKGSSIWFRSSVEQGPFQKKNLKRVLVPVILASFLIILYQLFTLYSPDELVNLIGIRNGYIVGFVVSFFGGFSATTAVSMYATLIALISGGLNWVILGVLAGISLALGDMLMFYFGRKSREIVSGKWKKEIDRFAEFIRRKNLERFIPGISYVYIGFLPLPNDWLLLFLAAIDYPPKKINKIIILGDLTLALGFCFLTASGFMLFA